MVPGPTAKSGLSPFDPFAPSSQNGSHPTHPILGLLVEGERKWADLVERQSRTLEEAVVEYKKRYGRNPPKGFDHWWSFAQGAQVLLPDEVRLCPPCFTPAGQAARGVY